MRSPNESVPRSSSAYTVLMVENLVADREQYRHCLLADINCCYTLLEADSITDALAKCQNYSIDGILIDETLPNGSGLDIMQMLQRQFASQCPPVVIVGSGPDTSTAEAVQRAVKAMKQGAEDYLVKQALTAEQLQVAMRSAIENTRLRRQRQRGEERFRISLENTLDCFGIFSSMRDESGQIVDFRVDYLNESACISNRMTRERQMGHGLCELFPAYREVGLFDEYCQVVETGEPLVKESWISDAPYNGQQNNGQPIVRAFDMHVTKLDDGFVACWRDVTDRNRLEVELNDRVTALQTQLDSTPVGVAIAPDPSCAPMQCHTSARPMLGDCSGHSSKSAPWQEQPALQAFQKGQEVSPEDLSTQVAARLGRDVRETGIEIRLPIIRQQLAELESIYATAPVGLCFQDKNLRYVRINDRLASINGVPAADHIGRTAQEILPELADTVEALHRQVLQTGEPILNVEIRGTTQAQPGLEQHWLASYYPLKDATDQVLGVNVMVQEITERKQVEIEREQFLAQAQAARAEAEAANRSKDEFVSLVAHELRSPLNAILGWAKLLQTRSFDWETTHKALETIVRNTQAQVQLVEDLLDVSRMVRGMLHLEYASVNLSEVVEGAIETVRPAVESKAIQLETRLRCSGLIRGDFSRLQQVMLNLLANAIKFTPDGGRVAVDLSVVSCLSFANRQSLLGKNNGQRTHGEGQPTYAQIQIQDTGKGINPDFLPHIFEQFKQDQQNITVKQGLGLGLAIVKYIVEQHNGIVTAQSGGEGQGSTFTILLPLSQEDEEVHSEASLPLPLDPAFQPLSGIRVLLVDDDLDMLNLTAFILEQCGAVVKPASSTETALEQLSQFHPNLLISDIAMPGQNGYELLQQVQMMGSVGQIPAIALTADASGTRREDSFRAGFLYHLTKPVEPDELIRMVLAIFSSTWDHQLNNL